MDFYSTILIQPGLGNSGPAHWQSLWEKQFGFIRIGQQEWDTPVCSDWINTINENVMEYYPSDVIIVGHSLACSAIAYWAKEFNVPIKGALLVGPSDTEAETYPKGTTGFAPVPLVKLPFPSITVASTDDFYVRYDRAELFADSWGSKLVNVGDAGHINAASNIGIWEQGLALLQELDSQEMTSPPQRF
jgi:predicted alpha/beta hydrolase family esterase